jgi:hypothetical protein
LGAKPLHDVHKLEVSCLEVDTWLGVLDRHEIACRCL